MATQAATEPAPLGLSLGQPGLFEQVYALGRRAFFRVLRQPAQIIFPFVFPMLLFAVNAAGLDVATQLPGFPADDYRDFALAVPFMQGALFIAINAGTDLARDIETGFLNRLRLTPMKGPALLAGQVGGVIVVGVFQAVSYILVGLAIGVDFKSGPAGMVITVTFTLAGQRFMLLVGGPADFAFNESVSFVIETEDQAETDRLWDALIADGGEPSMCGWLKDRYGVSWQITPKRLNELTADPDPDRARRAMEAMLAMRKIDIAALERAADAA